DIVLRGRQLRAPFGIGLLDLEFLGLLFGSPGGVSAQPAKRDQRGQTGGGCKQDTAVNHGVLRGNRGPVHCTKYGLAHAEVTRTCEEFSHFLARSRFPGSALLLPRPTRGESS